MLNLIRKIIGTKNERELKRMRPVVEHIATLEPAISALTNEELRAKTDEFRTRIRERTAAERAQLDTLLAQLHVARASSWSPRLSAGGKASRTRFSSATTAASWSMNRRQGSAGAWPVPWQGLAPAGQAQSPAATGDGAPSGGLYNGLVLARDLWALDSPFPG